MSMDDTRTPTPSPLPPPGPPRIGALPGWLLVALAVTGILLVVLAAMAIRREEREERAHWDSHLSRLADDRLAVAERALHEWRHEAHLVGQLESVRALVSPRGASAAQSTLAHQELVETAGLEAGVVVGVTDRTGRVLSTSDDSGAGSPELAAPARMTIEERHPIIVRSAAEGSDALTLAIAEPLLEESGTPAGTVVLVVDAHQALGDLFARANATAHERLFVVVPEAGRILVVAPEWWGEAGAAFRLPASDRTTFASAALAGSRGAGEFSDGRGHRVLSASRRIPEIGWAIVVEVDRGEALAELGRRQLWIAGGAAGLLAAILALAFAWSRAARARY
ncbi:MAG TPA: cache domain-containing protein, partial [Thermoanaerobaculia bacterium]|nr:cache domain-containing protein [Thermoanaerobaculia bacterium]